jgi:hypothetical protein
VFGPKNGAATRESRKFVIGAEKDSKVLFEVGVGMKIICFYE